MTWAASIILGMTALRVARRVCLNGVSAAIVGIGAVLLRVNVAQATVAPATKCEALKNQYAGAYAKCVQIVQKRFVLNGDGTKQSNGLTRCGDTLALKWSKLEADMSAAGTPCPFTDDADGVAGFLFACSDALSTALHTPFLPMDVESCNFELASYESQPPAQTLNTGQTQCDQGTGTLGACPGSPAGQDGAVPRGVPRSYTDNGDGTITDNMTGLMWEKLSNDGSIHDWDDTYTWYTAFTTKIATLNGGSGFAGHTDWRLPNSFELHTLVDLGRMDPAIDPVFNTDCPLGCTVDGAMSTTMCSCTRSTGHWSSSTYLPSPANAWDVYIFSGTVGYNAKSVPNAVRAVRGGW